MLAVAGPPEFQDRYWLSRVAPHGPVRTRLAVKPVDMALPGSQALNPVGGNALRGAAWLTQARHDPRGRLTPLRG